MLETFERADVERFKGLVEKLDLRRLPLFESFNYNSAFYELREYSNWFWPVTLRMVYSCT